MPWWAINLICLRYMFDYVLLNFLHDRVQLVFRYEVNTAGWRRLTEFLGRAAVLQVPLVVSWISKRLLLLKLLECLDSCVDALFSILSVQEWFNPCSIGEQSRRLTLRSHQVRLWDLVVCFPNWLSLASFPPSDCRFVLDRVTWIHYVSTLGSWFLYCWFHFEPAWFRALISQWLRAAISIEKASCPTRFFWADEWDVPLNGWFLSCIV